VDQQEAVDELKRATLYSASGMAKLGYLLRALAVRDGAKRVALKQLSLFSEILAGVGRFEPPPHGGIKIREVSLQNQRPFGKNKKIRPQIRQ
jgi:hypothetical protein